MLYVELNLITKNILLIEMYITVRSLRNTTNENCGFASKTVIPQNHRKTEFVLI